MVTYANIADFKSHTNTIANVTEVMSITITLRASCIWASLVNDIKNPNKKDMANTLAGLKLSLLMHKI